MHYSYLGEVAMSSKQIRVGLIISSDDYCKITLARNLLVAATGR